MLIQSHAKNILLDVGATSRVITNRGAEGPIRITLPIMPMRTIQYEIIAMAPYPMTVEAGTMGSIFCKGNPNASQITLCGKDIPGSSIRLIADGESWIAIVSGESVIE